MKKKPLLYNLIFNYNYKLNLNLLLFKIIKITYNYTLCLNCKNFTQIFKNGFCKQCFFKKFYIGIFYPSKCTSHLNIANINLVKEKKLELQDHIIYLSFTGNIKVGITIKKKFFNRLMDQGAIKAIKIAVTPNRYLSGIIENICKNKISDRTSYKKMLTKKKIKNKILINIKKKLFKYIIKYYNKYKIYLYKKNNKVYNFIYPIKKYPKKITIFNFNKNNIFFKSKLIGIKGQYLIFSNNKVINIINHIGFSININYF